MIILPIALYLIAGAHTLKKLQREWGPLADRDYVAKGIAVAAWPIPAGVMLWNGLGKIY